MKQANRELLDKHRPVYDVLIRAQYLKGLNGQEIDEMLQVMREEFQPGYATDLWCGPCLIDFVKLLYRMYDDWIARQPKAEPVAQDEPLIVAASFPSNKEDVSTLAKRAEQRKAESIERHKNKRR